MAPTTRPMLSSMQKGRESPNTADHRVGLPMAEDVRKKGDDVSSVIVWHVESLVVKVSYELPSSSAKVLANLNLAGMVDSSNAALVPPQCAKQAGEEGSSMGLKFPEVLTAIGCSLVVTVFSFS